MAQATVCGLGPQRGRFRRYMEQPANRTMARYPTECSESQHSAPHFIPRKRHRGMLPVLGGIWGVADVFIEAAGSEGAQLLLGSLSVPYD